MDNSSTEHKSHVGYGGYVLVWLVLVGLTVTTVAVAGINLGNLTLFTAMFIAAVKSTMVINIFMHIKYDNKLFKVFLIVTLMTLLSVFVLISLDIFFR